MLASFADAADPDAGLLAYRRVSESLDRTPWFLRLLRDEGQVAARLARLLAGSAFVADLFVRAPEAVELLGGDDALVPRAPEQVEQAVLAVVRRRDDWEDGVSRARALRRAELLRTAAADLEGLLSTEEVGRALTAVAGSTVSGAFEAAWRKVEAEQRGDMPFVMTVIAMGRLGGYEQGYGSDADVHVRARRRATEPRSPGWPRWPARSPRSCAGCWRCPPRTRRCSSTRGCARRASRGRSRAASPRSRPTTSAGRWSGRARRCCGRGPSPVTRTWAAGSSPSPTATATPRRAWT